MSNEEMNENKHTPGPWAPVVEARLRMSTVEKVWTVQAAQDCLLVAVVTDLSCELANARVLAAAPELLHIVEDHVAMLADSLAHMRREGESFTRIVIMEAKLSRARAAVAKAKGESVISVTQGTPAHLTREEEAEEAARRG